MWTDVTIEERDHPTNLRHYDGRLYWLIDDDDAQPTEDSFGRTVARKMLISYDIETGDRYTLAGALPPSQTLAVGSAGIFVWGLGRESVLRISQDGAVE